MQEVVDRINTLIHNDCSIAVQIVASILSINFDIMELYHKSISLLKSIHTMDSKNAKEKQGMIHYFFTI